MSDAKTEILSRIRGALGEARGAQTDTGEVARAYLHTSDLPQTELIEMFAERTTEYRAMVYRTTEAELKETVSEVCRLRKAKTLVVSSDIPDAWLLQNVEFIRDDGLTNAELSAADGVLSGCALAVAQTGTLVLDGGSYQGRRALTLLPDLHLCVVFVWQIVGTVPEAVTALQNVATQPLTFISGPSATSDIELSRVEGVHGPRTLNILLVEES